MVNTADCQTRGLLPTPTGALAIEPCQPTLYLSLVLPTYNERQTLPALLAQLTALLDRRLPNNYEVIVADDDSPDRTWELALGLMHRYPHLRVLRRQDERGLASAVARGWQAARGEVLGVMDADLQHPPATLLDLVAAMHSGVDLAIASRHSERDRSQDWSRWRQLLSSGARGLCWLLLPQASRYTTDPLSGYFLVRRQAIANCLLAPVGYKILLEVMSRGRIARWQDVSYSFGPRAAGESKVTQQHYWEYLQHLWSLRRLLAQRATVEATMPLECEANQPQTPSRFP